MEFIICVTPLYNVTQQFPKPSAFLGKIITAAASAAEGAARETALPTHGLGGQPGARAPRPRLSQAHFLSTFGETACQAHTGPWRQTLFSTDHRWPAGVARPSPALPAIPLVTLCSSI